MKQLEKDFLTEEDFAMGEEPKNDLDSVVDRIIAKMEVE